MPTFYFYSFFITCEMDSYLILIFYYYLIFIPCEIDNYLLLLLAAARKCTI